MVLYNGDTPPITGTAMPVGQKSKGRWLQVIKPATRVQRPSPTGGDPTLEHWYRVRTVDPVTAEDILLWACLTDPAGEVALRLDTVPVNE